MGFDLAWFPETRFSIILIQPAIGPPSEFAKRHKVEILLESDLRKTEVARLAGVSCVGKAKLRKSRPWRVRLPQLSRLLP